MCINTVKKQRLKRNKNFLREGAIPPNVPKLGVSV